MEIFKTTRKIEKFNLDENDFFNFLKENYPDDESIRELNSFNELINKYSLWDFDEELEEYFSTKSIKMTLTDSHTSYYDEYYDAYEDMEWEIH